MKNISNKQHKFDASHYVVVVLGIIFLLQCGILLALLYAIVTFFGMIWFMAKICPHCKAYGTIYCPSRYGRLSRRIFKRPKKMEFKRAFKRNIWVVSLQWFIPLIAGIYCLFTSFDLYLFLTFIIFIIVAFLWLPLFSRKRGCANCPQRNECAWSKK